MFKKIDHIEIIPVDLEATIDFYIDILGFKIKHREVVDIPPLNEVIFLELNGTVVEILSIENPVYIPVDEWQTGYRMLALEVENMGEAVSYLETKGIEISKGPVNLGESKRAEIKDPNGLSIELREW